MDNSGGISITNEDPDGANAIVPFVPEDATSPFQPDEATDLPEIEQPIAVPFSDEGATSVELRAAKAPAAVRRADDVADEAVEVMVASEGGGRAETWTADFKQDLAWRQALVDAMHKGVAKGVQSDNEEVELIAKGMSLIDTFIAGKGKLRSWKRSKTVNAAQTKYDKKKGLMIGRVELRTRASPEQIIAYQMHYDSKFKVSQMAMSNTARWQILEASDISKRASLGQVVFLETHVAPFQNRTFLQSLLWQKISNEPLVYVWVIVPIDTHEKVPPQMEAHAVRGKGTRCIRLTRVASNLTRLEYFCSLDLNGHLPDWLTNNFAFPFLMSVPYELQRYFIQIRPIEDCDAEDGVSLGHILVDAVEAVEGPDRASVIRAFFIRTAMLRESAFTSFEEMITATLVHHSFRHKVATMLGMRKLGSKIRPAVRSTDPGMLTATDAEAIGIGFECIILTSATHVEAVDELLRMYPALGRVAQQHGWFQPMLETVAKRRMATTPFGLKLRLWIGAGFSMADMISDIVSIVGMMQAGQVMGAYGLIGLLSASVAMQLLFNVVINKHRGPHAVAWEVILVLSLLKPGVDALRVASNRETASGASIDPFTEMLVGKTIEIAFESGPGAALQAVIVLSGHWSTAAVVSVGISCLSIGFTTAMMAFDIDTNPVQRKKVPEFYGFTPDDPRRRLLVWVELFALHSTHATVKTLTLAMLLRTNWRWLVAYVAGDFCTFILYKLARADLLFWVPGLGLPLSLVCRFLEKVVLDSTGFVHLRNPVYAGGFYYCFNAVTTHIACYVAAGLYSSRYTGMASDQSYSATGGNLTNAATNGANTTVGDTTAPLPTNGAAADYAASSGKIDDFTLFATIMALSAVWVLSFVALMLTIKRQYRGSFVSLQTGSAFSQSHFLDHAGDDARRAHIFLFNERLWRSIRALVRQWALGAYTMWLQLRPAWFNDALCALIPDDFMPAPVVQQLDAQAPGGRRQTIVGMGPMRRMSLAFAGAEDIAELSGGSSDEARREPYGY